MITKVKVRVLRGQSGHHFFSLLKNNPFLVVNSRCSPEDKEAIGLITKLFADRAPGLSELRIVKRNSSDKRQPPLFFASASQFSGIEAIKAFDEMERRNWGPQEIEMVC